MGKQNARTGDAYVGFIAYNNFNPSVEREYLQVKLKTNLKEGSQYCVSFYVSLAEVTDYATNAIGAYLSELPDKSNKWLIIDVNPQVVNPYNNILTNQNWTCVKASYTAKGNEQYLTIGNFYNPSDIKVKRVHSTSFNGGYSYYYIDDVSIIPMSKDADCICIDPPKDTLVAAPLPKPDTIVPDSSIVLNSIFFETDKAVLLPTSYSELDKLTEYLDAHKDYQIALSGHTDNEGMEAHNQKLSEARAQSVANYLISNGIAISRISYQGFGSLHPITSNDTPEGKQKNRRVEFKLTLPK